jgi:hypothetical protein
MDWTVLIRQNDLFFQRPNNSLDANPSAELKVPSKARGSGQGMDAAGFSNEVV